MTTPYPSFGNTGGAMGTLGTSTLQQSIDALNNSVTNLATRLGSFNAGGNSGGNNQPGNGPGGGFPAVINPFRNNPPQPGIGGGGPGGYGNVTRPTPFGPGGRFASVGALAGSVAGYGNQQLPIQLGLNAYATQTALAMGQTSGNFTLQYRQAFGYQNANLNFLASSPMDALVGTQMLQSVAGNPMYMRTSMGRAGFGYAAGFGIANPLASFQQGAGFAQQLLNPQLSQTMMALGYPVTPRQLGTGRANSPASVVQGLLRAWYGQKAVNPSTLTAGLGMYGRDTLSLSTLGIDSSSAAPLIEEYNQLFRKGLSPMQAQQLINQAGSGSLAQRKAAQARLTRLGVSTATSSAANMRNNQSVLTGRDANVASGFAKGLADATSTLSEFNQTLSSLLTTLHANGILGYSGGMGSIFSGTNHGNALLGLGGLLGIGSGSSGTGGSSGLPGGPVGIGAAVTAALPIALGTGLAYLTRSLFSNSGPVTTGSISRGVGGRYTQASRGGGAASPQTSQSTPSKGNKTGGSTNGAAARAIASAESQLGVPYVWGGESPGVGFDCSGLTQWSYAQAGVQIPRTASEQWNFLRNKSVPMDQVRAGDLIFDAGADGTFAIPGHVGMMINERQLIQAPHTGLDIDIIGYDPREWQHAGRPSGNGSFGGSPIGSSPTSSLMTTTSGLIGDSGMSFGGNYGSSEEVDNIMAALGGLGGGGFTSFTINGNTASSTSSLPGSAVKAPSNPTSAQAMAVGKKLASALGWGSGAEWNALATLWTNESGWRWNAANKSGAYGIPQALPADKMASAGKDWKTNAATQIKWGLGYIKGRYGDPETALRDWEARSPHWYGAGGTLDGGISIVGDRGPEAIIGGSGTVIDNANTMKLLKAATSQPAQSPWTNITDMNSNRSNSSGIVHLHFNKESVVIRVEGSASDASFAGTQAAKTFVKYLADQDLYNDIGSGNKNGFK